MRFGSCNVRVDSLTAVARELARYILDFVVVQVVRWDNGGMVEAGDYIFPMEKEMQIINCGRDFLNHRIISAVKTVELVSNRM